MSRTPARCTQADLARAIRAAQQTGAGDVLLQVDGSILIRLSPGSSDPAITEVIDETPGVVL